LIKSAVAKSCAEWLCDRVVIYYWWIFTRFVYTKVLHWM